MNATLNWMSSATEKQATLISDQVGADIICNLGPQDTAIEQSDEFIFFINHHNKEFYLVPGLSNYTLICSRTK